MQREAYPRFSFDIVIVSTVYPGATPREIEKLITIPIEKELKQVSDIKEISSVSAEGISRISIKIEEDTENKNSVINEIQRAVDRVDDLPADLKDKPNVNEIRTKDKPIIEVALSGNLTEFQLREHAKALEKKLLDLDEVARIERRGFREREIWVEVDLETMVENHISLKAIGDSLSAQNKTIPGGKYYIDKNEYNIRTTGEFHNAADVRKTIVRASELGNWVPLKNIATVNNQFENETRIYKTQGTRSINLIVLKKEAGDTLLLVNKVKEISESFQESSGEKLVVSYVNDTSYFLNRRQTVLINNGIWGAILIIIALFTFLSVRTAIGALLGIPTALCLTFIFMQFFDVTFNMISMFGLIMVLGMLVDEDIVISENIHRHIELDKTTEDATINGVSEVVKPLVVTVLTTIAAFIPLLLMGGIMGKFVRHIPIVVSLTLLASLFQALIILPSHIFDLNHRFSRIKRFQLRFVNKALARLVEKYKVYLAHCIKRRYLYSGGLAVIFAATILFATTQMRFVLFPSEGIEVFYIKAEGSPGDSLNTTASKIEPIEKIVSELQPEELKNFTTRVGVIARDDDDSDTKQASYVAMIKVYLTPEPDRERDTQEIINVMRDKVKAVTHFSKIEIDLSRMGPPVGKPLQIRLRGDDFNKLQDLSDDFRTALKNIDGVTDIGDDYEFNKDEIQIVIDPIKAAQTGLSIEKVARAVRHAFEGLVATSIKTSEEEIDILVKLPDHLRYDEKALESLVIPNNNGKLIKISHIAKFKKSKGVSAIKHYDSLRTVNVTANIDGNITSPLEVSRKLKDLIAEKEKAYPGYTIHFGGEIEETNKSLKNLFQAFYFAGALILLILITTFRSLLQPFVIMLTIPFSIIGVTIAFYFHNLPFSFMALLGVVGLTGVVVDSGVIIIDFINRMVAKGANPNDAIIEGASIRLRAVILTTLTTFFAIIPAAYGFGGSDPFIRPMAIALNYGIVFGSGLTLIYVPVLLAIVEDIRNVSKKLWRI